MYQTTIKGDKRFHSLSEGYGAPVELFGYTEDGETPMSLVNIALASCLTMCLQSYFAKYQGIEELAIHPSFSGWSRCGHGHTAHSTRGYRYRS